MIEKLALLLLNKIKELNKIKAEDDLTDYGSGRLDTYKEILDFILNYLGEEVME